MAETVKTTIEKSISKTEAVTVDEAARASAVVDKAVAADPVLMNELNQEHPLQSRILWTGSTGVLAALGTILVQISDHGGNFAQYDLLLLSGSVTSLITAGGVLYARFYPGLKPWFYRWFR